ncbi:MAG TPA: glycosyltransferase family 2 protein [Candidatus Saccharimonadales bacterium]|nr:glycosyltransferase family 2 protein [Candidatus Saccharimonadales bacterium]
MKKITVLIPCFNEEKGLSKVLDKIPYEKLKLYNFTLEVIVIDNNSKDNTAQVARSKNAHVVLERKKGKGHAIKTGFCSVSPDTDYVVMLDGDNTYTPSEIFRMIEPLHSDFCDVIIGSRLGGKLYRNSFKIQNRIANWVYTFLVRNFYRANTTDVLSGYFAWKKKVIDKLVPHLESDGFSIEMEMLTKIVKLGYRIYAVPITYRPRIGESKIAALSDGIKILSVFFKNLFWTPKKTLQDSPRMQLTISPSKE